jgi:uncharacterized protein (DUF1330 family)
VPAYVIADVDITDPKLFEEYRKLVPATIEKHGGRYVVRGGETDVREGDWHPRRLVIIEFPSMEKAKGWYASPEYAQPLAMRKRSSKSKIVFVQGV